MAELESPEMAQAKRIAVLGAGPSGLTAIKSCKEEGFVPVCYERNSEPGGLWRYHDEDIEGVASVMRTTIINTSKEVSAFSDFPPPKEFPNYMHNSKMFEYFMSYAEHFDLLRHIRYNFEVVKVEPTKDFDETGRWTVTVRSTKTAAITKEDFDGVLVCVGHHVYPKIPTFPDQDKFKGTITHTHSLKNCDRYADQKVVVVGIGNSGVDAAADCTYVAKQNCSFPTVSERILFVTRSSSVYLSTRRGSWIFSRVGKNGLPFDVNFTSRKNFIFSMFKSYNSICDDIEKSLNDKFDHETYKLKPKHRVLSAHPTMNDALPNCILSGRVIVKGDIERFTENGILFVGEETVTKADAVILATGYHIKFPFLDSNILSTDGNRIQLYKYSIPLNLKHPTLALVGLIQPIGPIFPIAEMQCRWFMQIQTGKLKLPSKEEMWKDTARKNEANAKRYVESTRHTIQVDFVPFLDELASQFGAKPNFFKMAFTDPKLFWFCMTGLCVSYQFRLQGPHAWKGAREAILNYEERMFTPLNSNVNKKVEKKNSLLSGKGLLVLLAVSALGVAYGRKYVDDFPTNLYFNFRFK